MKTNWKCSIRYIAKAGLAGWCLLVVLAARCFCQSYDLSRDFSIAANPNGVWSYGAEGTIGGPFSLLTVPVTQPSGNGIFQSWQWGRYEQPVVEQNASNVTITNQGGQGIFPPKTVSFDTGTDGSPLNFGVIRFTVPAGGAGNYQLQAAVRPKFNGPVQGDTDFHVVQNGVEIYGKFLAPTETAGYTNVLALAVGDTVDFMLGRGADGREYGSGLKIQVTFNFLNSNPSVPTILAQPQSQTASVGGTASFTVIATGTAPLTYQWRLAGVEIGGATSSALVLANLTTNDSGNYTVDVINDLGMVTSSNAVLTVNPAPVAATYDLSRDFSIAANPNGVWSYGAEGTIGGPFSLLTVPVTQPSGNGIFQSWQWGRYEQPVVEQNASNVTITNQGGQGIFPPKTVSFDTGTDGSPLNFGVIRFKVPSGGAGNYQLQTAVQPKFNGPVAGDTDFHVVQNGVEIFGKFLAATESTGYTNALALAAGDTIDFMLGRGADGREYGSGLKIQATLDFLNVNPTIPAIVSQPRSQTVTAGNNVTFDLVANGTAPLTYQWRLNGADIPGATTASLELPHVQIESAGDYSVLVANAFGSVTSSVATLIVDPPPPCTAPPDGLVAWWAFDGDGTDSLGGNSAVLSGNTQVGQGEVGPALHFDGASAGAVVAPSPALNVGAAGGFTFEGWINPSSVAQYQTLWEWGNRAGLIGLHLGISQPEPYGGGSGSIWANLIDVNQNAHWFPTVGGLIAPNSWSHLALTYDKLSGAAALYVNGVAVAHTNLGPITVETSWELFLGERVVGATIQYRFGGSMDELSLYNRAMSAADVQSIFNAASAGKCKTPTAPSIVSQPQSRTVTVDNTVAFSVTARGTGPLSYQWRFNDVDLGGKTNSTLTLPHVQVTQSGNYSVVVSNAINSVTSSIAILTINPRPPCVAAPDGLVAWWRFEGDTADSTSGSVANLSGNTTFQDGRVGQALVLDGTTAGGVVAPVPALNIGAAGGFTVEGWINPSSVASYQTILEWGNRQGLVGLHLGISQVQPFGGGPGSIWANLIDVNQTAHWFPTVGGLVAPNLWSHFALTYDKASGSASLYVNGAVAGQTNFAVITVQTSWELFLGERMVGANTQYRFGGGMDEMSLYNRSLSSAEIQSIFNTGASGKCNTPVAPTIVSQPQSWTVTTGNNVTFRVTASGTGPLSYQWRLDGVNLAGATSPYLTFYNVQPNQAGGYSVVVANAIGSVTSDTATLTVNDPPPGPPSIVSISASQTVLAGQNASFTVVAIGTGALSYQWRLNQTNIVGATNATLAFTPAQVSNSGNYDVVVTDSAGSATSPTVSLTVTSTTQPPVITSQPGSRSVSIGDGTTFTAGVSGTGPITYQWYFNGSVITGAVANTLVFTNVQASQAGTYWIVATSPFGTAQSAGAILDVTGLSGAMIFVSLAGAHVYDVDGVTRLPAGTTFLAQLYAGPDSSSLLPIGAAVPFNSPGHFLAFERTIPTATPGQVVTVQFRVWESAYGPSYEAALAAGGKAGTSLILQAGTQAGGNPPPPPPELTGVQDFSLVPGQVASGPQITAQPVGQSVLLGAAASLSVSASGPGLLHYQWYLNGNPLAAATTPALAIQAAQLSDGGDYVAVVSNTSGSVTSQVATITVVVQRVVEVVGPPTLSAGSLITVPLQLTSQGDVGGMTFVLHYDPDYLSTPEVAWDSSLDGGLKDSNVPALGQLRGVFALPGTAVPAGTQALAVVSFHTRSVLVDSTTPLNLQVVDISQADGTGIQFGTEVLSCNVGIVATGLSGDANGNGMLDIGDATLLLRMLDQQDTIRSWDVTQNDLNQNGQIDSGDVIKIMRVAAGIDSQPGGGSPHAVAKAASPKSPPVLSELALLDPLVIKATNGSFVTVQVRLANIGSAISGASFTLNYPVAALRLLNSQAVATGPIVPGGAVAVWNVSPSQNNFATQNGHVTLAVSSGSAWAANDGVLAALTFQVQPGATNQYLWPLTLSGVQVTENGYNRSLLPGTSAFVGRNQLPGLLSGLGHDLSNHFQFSITGDPGASYIVDVSSNMVDWTPLATITNNSGTSPFVDTDTHNYPRRFYRTRPSP